ncbi:hypothetical protein Trihar35433_9295 [Trichoderma harzianum]|nr:hypothetical protein Trihar35433_9295 [Trichoderma harzianum]
MFRQRHCYNGWKADLTLLSTHEASETHLVQDSDHELFTRLDRIEGLLLEAKSHRSAPTKSHLADQPYAPLDYQFPTLSSRLAENQPCGETENSDVVVFGFDLHCLSSFGTKEFHQALLPLRVNNFEESLEQELKEGNSLFEGDQVELLDLDLSPQNCGRLQQLFARHVLPQRPIFDHETSSKLVARVARERPLPKTLDTAFTLLILALGSMSTDSQNLSYDPLTTPGLDYFRAACQIVDGDRKSNYTLQYAQCPILMSVYFQSCLLPIQAFESIRVASEKIVLLLQMRKRIASDRSYASLCQRAYWACYLIEQDLQMYISHSSCLLQSIHELVPLPTSDSEEPGFYGFLADIALCRIVARARNGISWNRAMLKEPVIVREIILQLSEWYATLPPPIKFPLLDLCQAGVFSNGTLLDTQQAQLRAKFFSTHAILHWPNVVLLLEIQSPTTRQADDQVNHDSSHILNGAAKALEFAIMSIYAFESLYSNPNLLMDSNGGTFYAIMILLLSVYNNLSLKTVQHPRTMEALCSGWHLLKYWPDKPAAESGREKVERLFREKGIRLPTHHGNAENVEFAREL